MVAEKHIKACASLPAANEMALELKKNKMLTITQLCRNLGAQYERVVGILISGNTGWTKEKLIDRGKEVRRARLSNGKRTKDRIDYIRGRRECLGNCGLLVEKEGHYCKFCVLEANGIHNLNNIRFDDLNDDILSVVRCDQSECFESLKIGG